MGFRVGGLGTFVGKIRNCLRAGYLLQGANGFFSLRLTHPCQRDGVCVAKQSNSDPKPVARV